MGGKRPWINDDGSRKSDAEISRLGQFWDEKTWERFLDEDVGKITDDGRFTVVEEPDAFSKEEYKTEKRGFSHAIADLKLAAVFNAAAEQLPPRERFILKRHFWDDSSLKEIAEETGLPPGTVRSTKRRSLKKLANILSSDEFGPKLARELGKKKYRRVEKEKKHTPLKRKVLDFIKDNLSSLRPLERRAAEYLYIRQMTLQNTATALGRTVGETKAIRASAFERLKSIYEEGYEKNRKSSSEAP